MPLRMLHFLTQQKLPYDFEDSSDIDRLLLCKSAGYVDADIPPTRQGAGYAYKPATVFSILPKGLRALTKGKEIYEDSGFRLGKIGGR